MQSARFSRVLMSSMLLLTTSAGLEAQPPVPRPTVILHSAAAIDDAIGNLLVTPAVGLQELQELVLSVCKLAEPEQCKDVQLQIASEFGASLQLPFYCAKQGQIESQKWIEEHPGWRIKGWKCPPLDKKQEA